MIDRRKHYGRINESEGGADELKAAAEKLATAANELTRAAKAHVMAFSEVMLALERSGVIEGEDLFVFPEPIETNFGKLTAIAVDEDDQKLYINISASKKVDRKGWKDYTELSVPQMHAIAAGVKAYANSAGIAKRSTEPEAEE